MLIVAIYILLFIILILIINLGIHLYKTKRITHLSELIVDGKFQLLINLTVIILMVITILEGQDSTNQTISALQREVSRQIDAYGKESLKIISASEKGTDKTTSEMKNIEARNKKINEKKNSLFY